MILSLFRSYSIRKKANVNASLFSTISHLDSQSKFQMFALKPAKTFSGRHIRVPLMLINIAFSSGLDKFDEYLKFLECTGIKLVSYLAVFSYRL